MSRSDQAGTGHDPQRASLLLDAWRREAASIPASAGLPAGHVDDRAAFVHAILVERDRDSSERDAAGARLGAVFAGHYSPDEVVMDLAGLQLALLTHHDPVDVGPLTRVVMRAYTVEQEAFALLATMFDPLTDLDTFNNLAITLWQLRDTAVLLTVGSGTDVASSRRRPALDRPVAVAAALRATGELRAACVLPGGGLLAVADSPAIAAAGADRLRAEGAAAEAHPVPGGDPESYARWLVSLTTGSVGGGRAGA